MALFCGLLIPLGRFGEILVNSLAAFVTAGKTELCGGMSQFCSLCKPLSGQCLILLYTYSVFITVPYVQDSLEIALPG